MIKTIDEQIKALNAKIDECLDLARRSNLAMEFIHKNTKPLSDMERIKRMIEGKKTMKLLIIALMLSTAHAHAQVKTVNREEFKKCVKEQIELARENADSYTDKQNDQQLKEFIVKLCFDKGEK